MTDGKEEKADLYPPEDRIKRKNRFTARERILILLKEKGVSYPAEIIAITGLHRSTLFDTLAILREEGKIKLLKISRYQEEWPLEFKRRIKEFWAKGMKGKKLQRLSLYVLVKETKKGPARGVGFD